MSNPSPANRTTIPGLVSIIIPTYNRARLLFEALDSCLAQTYRPIEIIVVDDGSTDSTRQTIKDYMDSLPPKEADLLIYLYQCNKGCGAARNYGFRKCRGEFCTFLDSDDTIEPEKLDFQVHALVDYQGDLCVGSYRYIQLDGKPADWFVYTPDEGRIEKPLVKFFQSKLNPLPSNWLFRSKIFESGLLWDENVAMAGADWNLIGRILSHGFLPVGAPKAITNYRVSGSDRLMAQRKTRFDIQSVYLSARQFYEILKSNGTLNEVRACFAEALVRAAIRGWRVDREFATKLARLANTIYETPACRLSEGYPKHLRRFMAATWRWGGIALSGTLFDLYERASTFRRKWER